MTVGQGQLGKRSVRDLPVAEGDRVLVRVDFNVPLEDGRVTDDARIRAALPTIELLLERGARLILCSHLGRPKGRDPETSLTPVSERLAELIDAPVHQAPDVIGPQVRRGAQRLEPGGVLVLENTRWERGETKNDPDLAKQLAGAGRRLRGRRLRLGPPRPRLHRRGGRAAALRGRAAARAGGDHAAGDRRGARAARWWWCWAAPRSPTRSP